MYPLAAGFFDVTFKAIFSDEGLAPDISKVNKVRHVLDNRVEYMKLWGRALHACPELTLETLPLEIFEWAWGLLKTYQGNGAHDIMKDVAKVADTLPTGGEIKRDFIAWVHRVFKAW